MFSREQVAMFVAMILGVVGSVLGKIKWVGPTLAAMVTNPAFEAWVVERVMQLLEQFGETPPATATACMAAAGGDGVFAAAPGDAAIKEYIRQAEQAMAAAGAK